MKKRIIQKNHCLNFLKGCACFCVLYMHTSYDCLFSSIISCLSRFAVLIFFMISGYYCFDNDREIVNQKMPRKVKHVVKLCIMSTVVFFLWDGVISNILFGNKVNIIGFVMKSLTKENLLKFVLFNQPFFGGIIWFIFALLYCYLIFWAVNKFNLYRVAYILVPILIILHIVTRGYIQYNGLIDENININWYRNFLFMGFPFFMLGNYIHKHEKKIIDQFNNKQLIGLICFGLALSCVERYIVVLELFWGTVIATFCMFVFAIKNPKKKIIPIISDIGEKYSTQIYIMHPIVSALLTWIKGILGIESNVVLLFLNPFIVYFLIPLIVMGYNLLKENIFKYDREVQNVEK